MKVSFKRSRRADRREKTFFAFWPVRIQNEFRWLEKVTITQTFDGDKWVSNNFK